MSATVGERIRVQLMTREFPPHVYGGAGVHVEHLVNELARRVDVEVSCFGDQSVSAGNPIVRGFPFGDASLDANPELARDALRSLFTGLRFNAMPLRGDVVHCHTWYSHFAGIVAKLAYGLPLVLTVHSLEPLRPWKREQLGRGYDVSSWVERTAIEMADAVIAVSDNDRNEIVSRFRVDPDRVQAIPNGIDTEVYRRVDPRSALRRMNVDPERPYVLCLGRITRQKGITHFLRAADAIRPDAQIVLCASGPDSPEIGEEVERAVAGLRARREAVVWIDDMVSREDAIALYSGAAVFCCPSIYEPFGIINLEAMACETAVVASAVGGIREVVVPGETGLLVEFAPRSGEDAEPQDAAAFAAELAGSINRLLDDEGQRKSMGQAGRRRVESHYGWGRIAERVIDVYRSAIAAPRAMAVGVDR